MAVGQRRAAHGAHIRPSISVPLIVTTQCRKARDRLPGAGYRERLNVAAHGFTGAFRLYSRELESLFSVVVSNTGFADLSVVDVGIEHD